MNANVSENEILDLAEKYPCNVLTEEVFQSRIQDIFKLLSNIVGKTLGPYGASTMIEELGDYHLTKDGFTVLKNIHFNNRKDNTILNLILMISHQMVMKVGDGSTTAIVAAREFMDLLRENPVLKELRPKDINEYIRKYVDILCDDIQADATQVTEENYIEVIRKIAKVALNDNEEYTNFIWNIYKESGIQTTISKRMSLTEKAHYDIMDDMFYIAGRYVDKVYCNAENGSKCNLVAPQILLFNFTLGNEHWDMIKLALSWMQKHKPTDRLLIIAPNYDQYFMDHVRSDAQEFISIYNQNSDGGGAIPFPMVFARNPFYQPVERMVYEDLPPFLGNRLMNPLDAEGLGRKITEFYKKASEYQAAMDYNKKANATYHELVNMAVQQGKDPKTIEKPLLTMPKDESQEIREEIENEIASFFGTCDAVSVGSDNIEFHGFKNMNAPMVEVHRQDAEDHFRRELDSIENARYISKDYIASKDRKARIACKSAIIYVGGHSNLEKKLNDDALDDAIHACQSTLTYGYNLGNNLAIIKAIRKELENESQFDDKERRIYHEIAYLLSKAFVRVNYWIHRNKHPDIKLSEVIDIVEDSIQKNQCFDLNTDEYSDNIINSCRTDIEVLRSAISIIGTIMSSNQYLAAEIQTGKDLKQ